MDIDIDKIRMVGDKIMIRRCYNPDIEDENGKPLVIMPDTFREDTNWCDLLAVGPKCKVFTDADVGRKIHVPDNPGRYPIVALDDRHTTFILKEAEALPAVFDDE